MVQVRFEIESVIVKPEVLARNRGTTLDVDPDVDTETLVEYCDTRAAAMYRAKQIYQRDCVELNRSCWGQVTVQQQRCVQPYDEYPQLWDWEAVGETESIE